MVSSKRALINDIHWGARQNSPVYHQAHIIPFYRDVFFPYLVENDIKKITILGDFVEHRKTINVQVLRWIEEHFFKPAEELGIEIDAFPGNHDVYYRHNNDVNVFTDVFRNHNITVYNEPTVVGKIAMVPWINNENHSQYLKWLSECNAAYVFGHFDIKGALIQKGYPATDGLDPKVFDKFEKVLTGHYHEKSELGNIFYLGTQYDITWSEYVGEKRFKGFHIFDEETGELEFVPNPLKAHVKIYYDDTPGVDPKMNDADQWDVYAKIVKVVVVNRQSRGIFERFVEKLTEQGPISIATFDESILYVDGVDDEEIQVENEISVIKSYIANLETSLNKERLEALAVNYYQRAVDNSRQL